MALINDLNTIEGKQEELRYMISSMVASLFQSMNIIFVESFNAIWFNNGLTPEQALEALGTDAVELFRLAEILTSALNAAKPDTITLGIPAGFTVTPNEDGTVTLSGERLV